MYLAKWVNRQHLITVIGLWFMIFGSFNIASNYLKKSDSYLFAIFDPLDGKPTNLRTVEERISQDFKYQAFAQIGSGTLLLVFAILQYLLVTFDPLDSNLIINEQCINLSAEYKLPKSYKAIQKSYLQQVIKEKIFIGKLTNPSLNKDES